jgi:biopolymer transport protein ExbB
MSLKPEDMVVSRELRFTDAKTSEAHLQAAIEERARRLAEIHRDGRRQLRIARRRPRTIRPKYRIRRDPVRPEERIAPPPDDKKARRWTVRGQLWIWLVLAGALVIGFYIRSQLPEFIKAGGPLVAVLIALMIFLMAIIIERLWTLRGAKGRDSLAVFAKRLQTAIQNNDIEGALDLCRRQRGSLANVVQAGLDGYIATEGKELTDDERMEETRRHLEEANALETPLLERNLVFLSTIASIGTMVGLTGTTVGMIRSFKAMAQQGMPDATQLALGISEALINTAGGLIIAQVGIVMYNYFVTRVDNYNYMMDETVYEILQLLGRKEKKLVS